ncbi:hypothetical protein V3C99_011205 [Haemonchus contortus]
MYAGNPILDEIKQGFKLRPTKTVDKSKPVIVAEIDDADSIAPTKRAPAPPAPSLQVDTVPSEPTGGVKTPRASPSPRSSPKPGPSITTSSSSAPLPGGGPPPPPPPPPGAGFMPPPPPPPPGAPPPPPPPGAAPPTSTPASQKSRKSPSPFPQLGGKSPAEIDLGELLHSIQGGVRLRKTVTNDKSGLIVDESLKQKSVQLIEPAPSTAFIPPKKDPPRRDFQRPVSPRNASYLQADLSDDERFLTPTGRGSEYGTPEPDSPRLARKSPAREEKKPDVAFSEKSLKVTKEELEQEIPTGTAAARIAKFMQSTGANDASNGGATVPRNFRPSPVRFPITKEVNNNAGGVNKPKAPSKWAPVETGGLRQPTRVNVPLDRNDRAHSEVRSRSYTNLNLQEPSIERARTQSPQPREPPKPVEAPPPTSRAARKSVGEEKRVRSDNPPPLPKTQPPSINEIPPSPKTSITTPYTFSKVNIPETFRPKSPASSGRASPSPSQSSASIPSPSSVSPGSTSPETPRKRSTNPAFDKAKEKFSGCLETPSASSRTTLTKGRSASPIGSNETSKNTSDVKKQRVINVPISAPWYHRSLSSSEASETAHARRVVIGMDSFSTLDPDTFRRNYRFNIDLSSDSPLSIVNR